MRVNEIFLSIQGEGINTGFPTIFIRFTGCNLRCSYCDTIYSYDQGEELSVNEIYRQVLGLRYKRVCITGGEPLLQDELQQLLDMLHDYNLTIETNGSILLDKIKLHKNHSFTMDIKAPSSESSDKMLFQNFNYLSDKDEVKLIVQNRNDYEWCRSILKDYYKKGIVTISPVFDKIRYSDIIEWVLHDGLDIRFQVQLHKIVWGADRRGV